LILRSEAHLRSLVNEWSTYRDKGRPVNASGAYSLLEAARDSGTRAQRHPIR